MPAPSTYQIDGEADNFPVQQMCTSAGVSTSGFYHAAARAGDGGVAVLHARRSHRDSRDQAEQSTTRCRLRPPTSFPPSHPDVGRGMFAAARTDCE